MSNSISTPNFIVIELETTKLGGGGGAIFISRHQHIICHSEIT